MNGHMNIIALNNFVLFSPDVSKANLGRSAHLHSLLTYLKICACGYCISHSVSDVTIINQILGEF